MTNIIREKIAFECDARSLHFVVTYLTEPRGDALVEIFKEGHMVKSVLWPAYKIWNIQAHAEDIAEDIEDGLSTAGWVGFGANVYQREDAK